ncbi:MAG: polymer-forming cytoskeletal protein [Opitutales bacterium]|nr:polymer-forming cytoskeletal protein [Opitutales bacterium]
MSTASNRAQLLAESGLRHGEWHYCSIGSRLLDPGDTITIQYEPGEQVEVSLINHLGGLWLRSTATIRPGSRLESHAEALAPVPGCPQAAPPSGTGLNRSDYVISGGTINFPSGSKVDGSVFGTSIRLSASAIEITGNLVSEGNILMESSAKVLGYVCTLDGDLTMRSAGTSIAGNAYVFGDVLMESYTFIFGDLYATGDVIIREHSRVDGNVHAGGVVSLSSSGQVGGSIFSGADVLTASSNTLIGGEVHAHGKLLVVGTRIGGDIFTAGNVFLQGPTTVAGEIHAGQKLEIDSGWGPSANDIQGHSYAGGNTNHLHPDSVFQPIPPRKAPWFPQLPEGCPPLPPDPKLQDFSPSSDSISIPQSSNVTLSPGIYGDLFIGGATTLTLTAAQCDHIDQPGCYVFRSIDGARWGQTLRLDLSGPGLISVFVEENVRFSGAVEISTDGINYTRISNLDYETAKEFARRVYWEIHGNFTITTHNSIREWFGTILTPGDLSFPSDYYGIGAYATIYGDIFADPANPFIIYGVADFARKNW